MSTFYCKNCGKYGHSYNTCHHPIISSGVICLKLDSISISKLYQNFLFNIKNKKIKDIENIDNFLNKNLKIILINRRISLNMIEFFIGKFNIENIKYIKEIYLMMSSDEINLINTKDFDFLWNYIWCSNKKLMHRYRKFLDFSKERFEKLKIIIKDFPKPIFNEPEWGIPKGRRKNKESNFDCANREFCEETGLNRLNYEILNIKPVKEQYKSTNSVNYRHYYYLSELNNYDFELKIDDTNKNQYFEIRDIKLLTIEEAIKKLRPYQKEKIKILKNIKKMVKFLILN